MGVSFFAGSGDFGKTSFGGLAAVAGSTAFAIPPSLGVLSCPMVTHTANPTATTVSAAAPMNTVRLGCDFFPRLADATDAALDLPFSKIATSSGSNESASQRPAGPLLGWGFCRARSGEWLFGERRGVTGHTWSSSPG